MDDVHREDCLEGTGKARAGLLCGVCSVVF